MGPYELHIGTARNCFGIVLPISGFQTFGRTGIPILGIGLAHRPKFQQRLLMLC